MTGAILAILSGSQVHLFSFKIAVLKSEEFFILHVVVQHIVPEYLRLY